MSLLDKLISRKDATYRYVFHHIPKCGGNSITHAFSKWFRCIYDYRKGWSIGEEFGEYQNNPIDISRLGAKELLCGHYDLPGIYLHERYPEVFEHEKYRLLTFVRDPLELKISLFFYEKRQGVLDKEAILEQQLFDRPNYLAERFPCTEQNYKAVLDRYYFIGITEHLQDSVDVLARLIGRKSLPIERINVTRREAGELSEEIRVRFREQNRLDYLVYDECCRRFERARQVTCGK